MRGFAEVEVRSPWGDADHILWHAGLVEPVDCGERTADEDEESAAPQRKLRPLAQTEALVKLVETTLIDETVEELMQQLEPHQLGVTTADGLILAVKVLRGCLVAIGAELSSGAPEQEEEVAGEEREEEEELDNICDVDCLSKLDL